MAGKCTRAFHRIEVGPRPCSAELHQSPGAVNQRVEGRGVGAGGGEGERKRGDENACTERGKLAEKKRVEGKEDRKEVKGGQRGEK